jgi:hypothetical protein
MYDRVIYFGGVGSGSSALGDSTLSGRGVRMRVIYGHNWTAVGLDVLSRGRLDRYMEDINEILGEIMLGRRPRRKVIVGFGVLPASLRACDGDS